MTPHAEKLRFPTPILDQHLVMLGKTGAGKSSVLRHIVEHLLSHGKRVVIIDPKGDWWGLKSSADGKGAGFPVIMFGDFKEVKAQDVPINVHSGHDIAELVAGGNRPCVIGFRGWTTSDMQQFWIDFAEKIFAKNAGELYIVGDEFHNFAPKGRVESPRVGLSLHWSNRLLSEGRGLGIVCLLASQRPQKVHNDTLTSCETLVAMRVIHSADREAVKDWIDGAGDVVKGKEVMASLAGMKRGSGWVWSPEVKFGPELIEFPMFVTFDSFAPPQLQKKVDGAGWAGVNLDDVKTKLETVIQEAEANDPSKLKARITELTNELRVARDKQPAPAAAEPAKVEIVERLLFPDEQSAALRAVHQSMREAAQRVVEAFDLSVKTTNECADLTRNMIVAAENSAKVSASTPPAAKNSSAQSAPAPKVSIAAPIGNGSDAEMVGGAADLPGPTRKILGSLAWWSSVGVDRPSIAQVSAVADYVANESFSTYLSRASTAGLITRNSDGTIEITSAGRKAAPTVKGVPTLAALHKRAIESLDGPGQKILAALLNMGKKGTTMDHLAQQAGYPLNDSFSTYLSRVSSRGFIVRDRSAGRVRPSDILYPEGLR